MNNEILASAIIGHMVGDYLLQGDWLAKNKKVSHIACLIHCLIWTSCVAIFSGVFAPLFLGFLFICHFVQDRSQFINWYMDRVCPGFQCAPLGPWSSILVDNTFHLIQIWIAWKFLL